MRIGIWTALLAGMAIAGCAGPPMQRRTERAPIATPEPGWVVVDAMPAFFDFSERARRAPRETWRALFVSRVIERHPELYGPAVLGLPDDEHFVAARDARIEPWLDTVPGDVEAMRTLHGQLARSLDDTRTRMLAALPSYRWRGPLVLMANVGSFNAGSRRVEDDTPLIFGIDTCVAMGLTDGLELEATLVHELFHMHQVGRDERIFTALWVEGLATYASIELTPGANDAVALPLSHVHDPEAPVLDARDRRVSLAEVMPEHGPPLARELLAVMTSTAPEDYATFFLGRASPELGRRPVRSGYWLGLEVVRRVARGRSLETLARLDPGSLEGEIRDALQSLATP